MASPLEELFEAAAVDPDSIVQPTYEFTGSLCYRTKGEADRSDGLMKILKQLYCSITTEDYRGAVRWTEILAHWINLEHSVPRRVRAALVRIYYDLALTPGMSKTSATAFGNIISSLVK